MAYDLPFLTSAQRKATNLRPRTEEELAPWGATTVPRAPIVSGPDVPAAGVVEPRGRLSMEERIEASRIYGAPEPGSLAAELGLQARPYPETMDRPLTDVSTIPAPSPYIPLTESGLDVTLPGQPAVRPPRTEPTYDPGGVFGDVGPDPGTERMQGILRGNIKGHALSGYNTMPPVVREMAVDRYEADWKKTQAALERADGRVSGFQTFLNTVDFGSAFFGGSFVDAWNNFKAGVQLNFNEVNTRWPGQDPTPDPTGMSPDFDKLDLGVGDHVTKFFGSEWENIRDTAERQQDRSGKVRLFSELLLPFEAGFAATLTRTGMNLVRATPAFAMSATRSSVSGLFTATKYQVKQMAQVADYPSWTWQDPYNWEPAWRQRGGVIIPNTMGQAYLEEFGLLLDESANIYAGPLRSMSDTTASIATTDNALLRFALLASGINPSVSIASLSPTGKLLVGMNMQKVAAEELVNTALLAGYDRHGASGLGRFVGAGRATPGLGRLGGGSPLQKISNEGFYGDTGVVWQKVFENPTSE